MLPLEQILKYPIVFGFAAFLSVLLTRFWGPRAAKWGFVDLPGGRKIHENPIPVAGGIAVFLAFQAACALIFWYPWAPFASHINLGWWYRFLPLSTIIVLLGLIDDRWGMKPMVKLAGQTLVAVAAYAVNIRVQNVLGAGLPVWFDFVFTIFWFLLLVNAFNLIDGMDGLASGIGALASIGMAVSLVLRKSPGDVLLFLALSGACLGFLRYNFYPAKVFLGDTGSQFIGFTLAALTISTSSKGPAVAVIGMPLLAVGVPLFDTMLAVWRRSVRRILSPGGAPHSWVMAFQEGDADHLHHRLLTKGRMHSQVALYLYGGTVLLAATGVVLSVYHDRAIGILALAFVAGSYTIFRHLAWIELQDSGRAVLRGIRRPVRRNQTLLYYLAFDLVVLHVAWLSAVWLLEAVQEGGLGSLRHAWIRSVSTDIAIPFAMLVFSRSYSRVWYLARVTEYAKTGMALLTGFGVACGLQLIFDAGAGAHQILHYVVMASVAFPAVVGVRAALRLLQDFVQMPRVSLARASAERAERAIVWGGGYETALFLTKVSFDLGRQPPVRVLGIFSADDAVRGHYVHGVQVIGGIKALQAFVQERDVDTLYLTGDVSAEEYATLQEQVQAAGIRIVTFRMLEEVRHD